MPRCLRWLAVIVVAGTAMSAGVLAGAPAPACACGCPAAVEAEYVQRADLSFEGVVVDIDEPFLPSSDANPVTVRFRVESVAKGEVGARVALHTALDEARCGFAFATGHRYRVYAVGHITGRCSGNKDLGVAPDVPLEEGWPWTMIGLGVGTAALAGVVVVLLRRGNRRPPDSL